MRIASLVRIACLVRISRSVPDTAQGCPCRQSRSWSCHSQCSPGASSLHDHWMHTHPPGPSGTCNNRGEQELQPNPPRTHTNSQHSQQEDVYGRRKVSQNISQPPKGKRGKLSSTGKCQCCKSPFQPQNRSKTINDRRAALSHCVEKSKLGEPPSAQQWQLSNISRCKDSI